MAFLKVISDSSQHIYQAQITCLETLHFPSSTVSCSLCRLLPVLLVLCGPASSPSLLYPEYQSSRTLPPSTSIHSLLGPHKLYELPWLSKYSFRTCLNIQHCSVKSLLNQRVKERRKKHHAFILSPHTLSVSVCICVSLYVPCACVCMCV